MLSHPSKHPYRSSRASLNIFESILKHRQGHAALRSSMSSVGNAQLTGFGPNSMLSTPIKVFSWARGSLFFRILRAHHMNTSLWMGNCKTTFSLDIDKLLKTTRKRRSLSSKKLIGKSRSQSHVKRAQRNTRNAPKSRSSDLVEGI